MLWAISRRAPDRGRRLDDVPDADLADVGVGLELLVRQLLARFGAEIGHLVDDDLGAGLGHGCGERRRIEHVHDRRPGAGGRDRRRARVGARGAGDVVARRDEHRRERTPDRAARARQEDPCHALPGSAGQVAGDISVSGSVSSWSD